MKYPSRLWNITRTGLPIAIESSIRYDGGSPIHWAVQCGFRVGRPPSQKWAPGHYAVFVYAGGRKVAVVYYEVTP